MKMAVLAGKLAPGELKSHLAMNTDKYKNYQELLDFIEDYIGEKDEDEGPDRKKDRMDVGAFDKNRRKGKDRKGKKGDKKSWSSYAYTPVGKQTKKSQKKKGDAKKGYDDSTRSWQQPKGGGAKAKFSEWFEGRCDWCEKYGHKKLQCWAFQKTDQYLSLIHI